MTAPLARVTLWLLLAQAMLAAVYWALLSTPESNVLMLGTSALLVVLLLAVAGLALDVAMRLWAQDRAWPRGLAGWVGPAVRLVPALALGVLIAWAALWGGARVEAARGSITAVFIARTGWADPEMLFTAASWLVALASRVVAPMVGLALFGALTRDGWPGVAGSWLTRALGWRALTTGVLVGLALMWTWPPIVGWRPASLPPTWVQVAFLAAKLGLAAAAAAVGTALVIRETTLDPRSPSASVPPP